MPAANSVIAVIEYNDDNDDAFDDFIRIQADSVGDPSDPQSYVAALEDHYAQNGESTDMQTDLKKLVFEEANGKVVQVLFKTAEGFSETDPNAADAAEPVGAADAMDLMIPMSEAEPAEMEQPDDIEVDVDAGQSAPG